MTGSPPLYTATVEVFQQRLVCLEYVFDKGVEFAAAREMTDEQLLGARLHADMLPLSAQIQIASDQAKGGAGRVAGVEVPVFEDDETTVAEIKARIAKTKEFLDTLTPAQFEGAESRRVRLTLAGTELDFAAPAYVHHFAAPNLYFHVVTAYDILRAMGAPIGKRDFFAQQLITE